MGELSAKQKLLNEITKLTLKEPISIAGSIETKQELSSKGQNKKSSDPRSKKLETPLNYYQWNEEKPIYLIAAFNQTTAIYVPKETSGKDRGEMLLLRNELINLMGLKGGKDKQEETVNIESKKQ